MLGMEPKPKSKRFLLVYGSETGQAKAIAEEIAEKSPGFGLEVDLHCLDETGKRFNIENEKCLVIITSTTGDGDPPSNASKFMRRIKKRTLTDVYLGHLNYALLGLGDTNYSNFCRCAQDIDQRLEQLGAKRFYPTGLADDGIGLEVVAEPWLEGLYPALQKFLSHFQNAPEMSPSGESVTGLASMLDIAEKENVVNNVQSLSSSEIKGLNYDLKDDSNNHIVGSSVNGIGGEEQNTSKSISEDSSSRTNSVISSDYCNSNSELHPNSYSGKESNFCNETVCVKVDLTDIRCGLNQPSSNLDGRALTIPVLSPPFLRINLSDKTFETSSLSYQNNCKLPSAASEIISVPVSSAKVLTHEDAVKTTLLLTLNHKGQEIDYHPGDAISIVCPNNQSEVDLLLERLDVLNFNNHKMTIELIPNTQKRRAAVPPHIHPETTIRYIFMHCVSIRDQPSKALLRVLAEYAKDENEIRRLQELCSKEGATEYTEWIREKHVSLLDLLYAFPSCHPPLERLLEFLPRLQPRPYSICSFSGHTPESFDIVFNIVNFPAAISTGHLYDRRGVCTGWLDDMTNHLQNGQETEANSIKIPIFLRTNQHFRPPSDLSEPLIMVGPGTGVAPFIGFLQQRACMKKQLTDQSSYGETWIFYGCRNKNKDFLFKKELEEFLDLDVLNRLCVAVSRDEMESHRYVQDFIQAESHSIARLIYDNDALVYICGDAQNMAKDVGAAFEHILVKEKGISAEDAHLTIMKKRLHKTYFEDVWV